MWCESQSLQVDSQRGDQDISGGSDEMAAASMAYRYEKLGSIFLEFQMISAERKAFRTGFRKHDLVMDGWMDG
jgi:hypothetical protein